MAGNKRKTLPQTDSIDELVEFFETHDMGEYWDQMPEVDFDIDIRKRRHLVALDEDLIGQVSKIARARHVPSQSLINSFLREKLAEAS